MRGGGNGEETRCRAEALAFYFKEIKIITRQRKKSTKKQPEVVTPCVVQGAIQPIRASLPPQ